MYKDLGLKCTKVVHTVASSKRLVRNMSVTPVASELDLVADDHVDEAFQSVQGRPGGEGGRGESSVRFVGQEVGMLSVQINSYATPGREGNMVCLPHTCTGAKNECDP